MITAREPIQLKSLAYFFLLVAICIGSSVAGQMFFPGSNILPHTVRMVLTAAGTIVLAVGSERLLARQFGDNATLGLRPSGKAVVGLVGGCFAAFLWIGLLAAAFWLLVPFHFERGSLTAREIVPAAHQYFWSNFGEELVFRGYLLIVVSRAFGLRIALALLALFFGLFHLPGLSGIAAVKMIFTTAAASYFFAAVFLATGTLWTAVALHFMGNVALHKISGLDGGAAMLKPVLHSTYPRYDSGFWVFVTLPLFLSWLIFSWHRRHGRPHNSFSKSLAYTETAY